MRLLLPLLALCALASPALHAQNYTTKTTTNEKALAAFKEGQLQNNQREPAIALGYFEKALKIDPKFIDARLALADTHDLLRDFPKAEQHYEEALALDSSYAPVAFFFLAQVEWKMDKHAQCAAHCSSYLGSNAKKYRGQAEKLRQNALFAEEALRSPVPFVLRNLGPGVNTAAEEYFPSITADGKNLVFTRNRANDENFYNSAWLDSAWQKAAPLEGVNTPQNEGAQSISPDGSWLVFTACNREDDGSQGSCDLYWSQQKSTGWTTPAPFSATINSPDWDSQPSISADGKTIVFCSRRSGGRGREDLWMTTRQPGGKWSKPQNLGPGINTPGVEQTPFLHPDGQTLYFASDSLPGMGGQDLYLVRRNADSTWGKPQNLGYPINTKADEVALNVSLDGKTAYYATSRSGGFGGLDIYAFELPEKDRPQAVTYVKALVRDAQTLKPLVAKVEFGDLAKGGSFLSASTKADGTFLVCLPAGKSYSLFVNKEKYLFYSDNFDLAAGATAAKPFLLTIDLQPVVAGDGSASAPPANAQPVVLRNVFFETGSAALRPESAAELDRLKALLEQYPQLRIRINGHTDNVGNDSDNQKLSEARAQAVQDYLLRQGIAAARLQFKGFGESRPLRDNDSPEGRAQNRRTEFVLW